MRSWLIVVAWVASIVISLMLSASENAGFGFAVAVAVSVPMWVLWWLMGRAARREKGKNE